LMAVGQALAEPDYRPGDVVTVPLSETIRPLNREACLAALAPRGVA
jgi:hypothetical protein